MPRNRNNQKRNRALVPSFVITQTDPLQKLRQEFCNVNTMAAAAARDALKFVRKTKDGRYYNFKYNFHVLCKPIFAKTKVKKVYKRKTVYNIPYFHKFQCGHVLAAPARLRETLNERDLCANCSKCSLYDDAGNIPNGDLEHWQTFAIICFKCKLEDCVCEENDSFDGSSSQGDCAPSELGFNEPEADHYKFEYQGEVDKEVKPKWVSDEERGVDVHDESYWSSILALDCEEDEEEQRTLDEVNLNKLAFSRFIFKKFKEVDSVQHVDVFLEYKRRDFKLEVKFRPAGLERRRNKPLVDVDAIPSFAVLENPSVMEDINRYYKIIHRNHPLEKFLVLIDVAKDKQTFRVTLFLPETQLTNVMLTLVGVPLARREIERSVRNLWGCSITQARDIIKRWIDKFERPFKPVPLVTDKKDKTKKKNSRRHKYSDDFELQGLDREVMLDAAISGGYSPTMLFSRYMFSYPFAKLGCPFRRNRAMALLKRDEEIISVDEWIYTFTEQIGLMITQLTFNYHLAMDTDTNRTALRSKIFLEIMGFFKTLLGTTSLATAVESILESIWLMMPSPFREQGIGEWMPSFDVSNIAMLLLTIPFMPSISNSEGIMDTFSRVSKEYSQRGGTKDKKELFSAIVDYVKWLFNTGVACFYDLSLAPFFRTSSPWVEWYDKAQQCALDVTRVGIDLEAGEYDDQLSQIITQGQSLRSAADKKDTQMFGMITSILVKLNGIASDKAFRAKVAAARSPPFYIGLFGAPKTGKTVLMDELIHEFYATIQKPYESSMKYIRPSASAYDDGLTSAHRVHIFDDVGMIKTEVAPEVATNVAKAIMELANTQRAPSVQADLPDKGRIFAHADLVILSSNSPTFGAEPLRFASAYHRRIRYKVTLCVRPEFREGESNTLSTAKILAKQKTHPGYRDFQTFTVSEYRLCNNSASRPSWSHGKFNDTANSDREAVEVEILNSVSGEVFFEWYRGAVLAHMAETTSMSTLQDDIADEGICFHCKRMGRCELCSMVKGLLLEDNWKDMSCNCEARCTHVEFEKLCEHRVHEDCECELYAAMSWETFIAIIHKGKVMSLNAKTKPFLDAFLKNVEDEYGPLGQLKKKYPAMSKLIFIKQGGIISSVRTALDRKIFDFGFKIAFEEGSKRLVNKLKMASAIAQDFFRRTGKYLMSEECTVQIIKWLSRGSILGHMTAVVHGVMLGPDTSKTDELTNKMRLAYESRLARIREKTAHDLIDSLEQQGNDLSLWVDEKINNAKMYNQHDPWVVEHAPGLNFTNQAKCITQNELIKKVRRNQVLLYYKTGETTVRAFVATGLDPSGRMLSTAHEFPIKISPLRVHMIKECTDVGWLIQTNDVLRHDMERDVCIFVVPRKFKSLFDYIPIQMETLPNLTNVSFVHPSVSMPLLDVRSFDYEGKNKFRYDVPCHVGYCGGLIVGQCGKNSAIFGMHHLGTTRDSINCAGLSIPLEKKCLMYNMRDFERKLDEPLKELFQHNGLGIVDDRPFTKTFHYRAYPNFRNDFGENMVPLGTIPFGIQRPETSLEETPLFGFVPPTIKTVPDFRIGTFDGVYRNPYNDVVDSLADKRANYPQHLLDVATEQVKLRMTKKLALFGRNSVPLDEKTSLNGLDGVRFIDALKRMTGSGLPTRGPKDKYIIDGPERKYTVRARESVQLVADYLARHENPGIFADLTLKDEIKKPSKKIRGFAAMPFQFNDIMRRICLPLFKIIQENPNFFGISVGMNCDSYQWRWFYEKHANLPFAVLFDFTEYDRSHSNKILKAAHLILLAMLNCIMKEDAMILGHHWATLAVAGFAWAQDPIYNVNDVIYRVNGSLASGLFYTAVINTIIQMLILQMIWNEFIKKYDVKCDTDDSFMEHNAHSGYGDDGMLSTDQKEFNLAFFVKTAAPWDLRITDPNKREIYPESFPLNEWSYLKRSFTIDTDHGWVLAPLELDSIAKSLNYWVKPTNSSIIDELCLRVNTCLEYLSIHTSEEAMLFEKSVREGFKKVFPEWDYKLLTRQKAFANKTLRMDNPETVNPENVAQSLGLNPALFEALWSGRPFRSDMSGRHLIARPPPGLREMMFCRLDKISALVGLKINNHLGGIFQFQGNDRDYSKRNASMMKMGSGLDEPSVPLQQTNITTAGGDEMNGDLVKFESAAPETRAEMPGDVSLNDLSPAPPTGQLGDFLKRPIEIYGFSWTPSTTSTHFDPWVLWLQNTSVRAKLLNYRYLRGTLHLSIQYNGTPFHYGSIMMSYEPCNNNRNSLDGDWRQHSNCPHVLIDPNTNATGSITCPFISPYTYIDLTGTVLNYTTMLGVVNVDVLSTLRIFQGGTPSPVEVNVYAWMDNVELAYPTTTALATFIAQGGDEYEVKPNAGVISGPAATIASIAGKLKYVPYIGRFALATEMASSTVGAIAKMFGFSRPADLSSITTMREMTIGDMVHTDTNDSSVSLTVNSKAELSIDPNIVGYGEKEDDLSIKAIISKWTLCEQLSWNRTQGAGTVLKTLAVTPGIGTKFDTFYYNFTSLGFIATLFKYWHGTIQLKVRIVASRMHRGRLRFQWTPTGSTNNINLTYSHIVDISGEREYCVSLPYASHRGYLSTDQTTESTVYDDLFASGQFRIIIQNQLVCPTDEPIYVWLSVRGGDDMRFAAPAEPRFSHHNQVLPPAWKLPEPEALEVFEEQSGAEMELGKAAEVECVDIEFVTPKYLADYDMAYFGDPVRSLRALMKRYSLVTYAPIYTTNSPTSAKVISYLIGMYPPAPGYSSSGNWTDTAPVVQVMATSPSVTTMLEPCFLGKRGSFRWIVDFSSTKDSQISLSNWSVVRRNLDSNVRIFPQIIDMGNSSQANAAGWYLTANRTLAEGGQNFPSTESDARIHYQMPFYSNLRYTPVFDMYDNIQPNAEHAVKNSAFITGTLGTRAAGENGITVSPALYAAAGEDFTMFFFRGVPRMFANGPPAYTLNLTYSFGTP